MLLIIGNGFDLQIKLPSSFKNYIESFQDNQFSASITDLAFTIREELESKKRIIVSYKEFLRKVKLVKLYQNNLSFWHTVPLFFRLYRFNDNWSDFESMLMEILQNITMVKNIDEIEYDPSQDNIEMKVIIVYILSYYLNYANNGLEVGHVCDWLLRELTKFENHFKLYLEKKLADHRQYSSRSHVLLKRIIGQHIDSFVQIINFNYTLPETEKLSIDMINIHGRLDSNIIIGIDQTYNIDETISDKKNDIQKKFDNLLYPFTKTYKKMLYSPKDMGITLNKNHERIIFYGHSLTPQDYSYFQSIFDYYNIYHNDIQLSFVFSKYDDSAYINTITGAIKLINKYGETMSNKDHGRNLLHKLELENRISIVEIDNLVFL